MSRGRPAKYKDPIRRYVTADKLTFAIIDGLGYDYSTVFDIGVKECVARQLKTIYPGSVGLFRLTRMDAYIMELEEERDSLTEIIERLKATREEQSALLTLNDTAREQQRVFEQLAEEKLSGDEITAYHKTMQRRVLSGTSAGKVADHVITDIRTRTGPNDILDIIEKSDRKYRENLVWTFLDRMVTP